MRFVCGNRQSVLCHTRRFVFPRKTQAETFKTAKYSLTLPIQAKEEKPFIFG
ncbi:MAG: hypothetical protein KatS3mg033_0897 [Thermonema sp.]|nr:MAG: hypothetical protein KatS3mg033_0897 [Thermonema sp.]